MLTPKDARLLREAWHGPKTVAQLAKDFCLYPTSVPKFWRREKAAGRLPKNQPRPCFREVTAVAGMLPVPQEIVIDADLDREIGASEIVCGRESYAALAAAACDGSLAALRAAHGDDPAHFHTMPAEWLLAESNSHLVSANEWAAARIIASLKKYLPHRDRLMSAFLKKRAERIAAASGGC